MLVDLLFPKFCVGCGFWGVYICVRCQKQLVADKDNCLYCGKASYRGLTHPSCTSRWGVDGVLSVFHYNTTLQKIIKSIKYRMVTEVYPELLSVIPLPFLYKLLFFRNLHPLFHFQSVPLHPRKMRERGFNQADRWRDFVATFLPASPIDCLVREKDTLSQAQIRENAERHANMRRAFHCCKTETLTGTIVVLFDDVLTSGSTAKEACKTLKKSGVDKVYVFTLGRG